MIEIDKPIDRSRLRRIFGKEYHILKRRVDWAFGAKKWAKERIDLTYPHTVFKHKSQILRPLKDVQMYLQLKFK
ncbi:MAG: hypothetical protein JKY09_02865 [Crocinitomicaceae bacterium]|nr:hypothetical protein [Crocinitomicaceae bacterium]